MNTKKLTIKILLALALATTPAYAAELPSFDMEEIIVIADAYKPPINTDSVNVKVVNPGKATTVPDLLRQTTGLDIQARSPHDSQDGTVKLRGFDARRFTILVDGRPMNLSGVMGGSYMDWNAIPLDRVEKIQIIKGAKAAAYGNTLGGVINIVTKDYQEASGQLEYGIGENGLYQRRFNYGAGDKKFSWNLYGNQFGNDAFLRNNDYDADQYGFALKYNITTKDSVKFDWNKAKEKRGMIIQNHPTAPNGYDPNYPVISATDAEKFSLGNAIPNLGSYWEKDLTTRTTTWDHKTEKGHFSLSYWENQEKRHEVNFTPAGVVSLDRTVIADESSGWLLKGQEAINGHTYGYGLESKQYRYGYGSYAVGTGSALYPSQKVNLLGGYLEDTWAIDGRWTGNVGLRYDKMEGRPDASPTTKSIDADSISPKVNFSFRNDENTTTFLSVSRLWRAPSMAEFYWWSNNQTAPMPGAVVEGTIKPEKGWGYEIGAERKLSPAFSTKLTAYYQSIDDYLNFTHLYPFSCYNIDNAKLWGFEWENNYQLNSESRFFLNYTNQHTRKNGVDPGDNLGLHNELDYRPQHKVAVGYQYDAKPWQFWYTIQYTGEQTANYPYGSGNILHLGGYTTHTVSVTRELTSDSSLTIAVDNLFDKYYVEQNNYPMPGRLVSATFKQKI